MLSKKRLWRNFKWKFLRNFIKKCHYLQALSFAVTVLLTIVSIPASLYIMIFNHIPQQLLSIGSYIAMVYYSILSLAVICVLFQFFRKGGI